MQLSNGVFEPAYGVAMNVVMRKQKRARCGICGGPNYSAGKYCADCRLDYRKDLERSRRSKGDRRLNEGRWQE